MIANQVKELIKDTSETAFNIDHRDLEKKFNMELPTFSTEYDSEVPHRVSKEYFNKIKKLRSMQRNLLPLYLEAQKVVEKHEKVFDTIVVNNQHKIPL